MPGASGAVRSMDISIVSEGATLLGSVMESTVSILSPPVKTNL